MKNSKLIKTLSTFSKKEYKEFEKITLSSFYNSDKHILFIHFISKNFPYFDEKKISKEKAFNSIYKNEKFADIRVRELMASVNKLLKEYLISLQAKSNNFEYELALLKQYNKRNLESLYIAQLKVVKSILKKDTFKNTEHFRRKYILANIEDEHYTNTRIRTLDDNIQVKLDNIDFHYFSIKLIESCKMLNRQKVLNQDFQLNLLEDIHSVIEKNKKNYLNHATIICYNEIYKLLQKDDDIKQLETTLKTLKKYQHDFTNSELKALYDFTQNYCIRQVNGGNDNYLERLFQIQEFVINKEFNFEKGFMTAISYRNIVTIAIKLKKYDWSKNFIEKYKEKVAQDFRENAYNLNKANLFYSTKDYSNTIKLLNQVEFTDALYASYSKIILLKTYYAEKEFETLSYFITAFKLYLKRNKQLNANFVKSSDIFLNYFKKIFNVAEKINYYDTKKVKTKLDHIATNIKNEKQILNRAWLLEIIEELDK